MDEVTVTQADRDAYLSLNMLPEFDAEDVRAGRWDNVTGVQAFARHRIAATADLTARLAEVEALLEECRDTFRMYEKSHRAKAAEIITLGHSAERDSRLEKAERNRLIADKIDALKGTQP